MNPKPIILGIGAALCIVGTSACKNDSPHVPAAPEETDFSPIHPEPEPTLEPTPEPEPEPLAEKGPSDTEIHAFFEDYIEAGYIPPTGPFGHLDCCYFSEIKRLKPEKIDTFSGRVTGYPILMDIEFDQYDGVGEYWGVNDFVLADEGVIQLFYNKAGNLDFQILWLKW